MTGLDKMKSQILDEAKGLAEAKKSEASQKVSVVLEEAKAEGQTLCERISQQSDADVKAYEERAKSARELQRKQALLKAKQEVISNMLDYAYKELHSQDVESYFAMIRKMLEKFTLSKTGDIYFSSRDLERMPQGFESEIQKIADTKGGKLMLSREGKNIEGGFVLAYGGIEENCTFKALFDAEKDNLLDQVYGVLFS